MIESATLEEEHQRDSNPSEQGVVKKFNTLREPGQTDLDSDVKQLLVNIVPK